MSSLSSLGVKITYLFLIPSLLIAREPEPISRMLVIGLEAAFRVNETLVRLNDRPRLISECQFDWFEYGMAFREPTRQVLPPWLLPWHPVRSSCSRT